MANELYFISILQEALRDPEPRRALGRALATIQRLGAQRSYRSGFENFQQFMEEVWSCHDLIRGDRVRELIIELVVDASAFSGEQMQAAMKVIDANPDWRNEYEQLRSQVAEEIPPAVEVYRGGQRIGEMNLEKVGARRSLGQIIPGAYLLRLNTGLVLWEGQLTGRDLLWAEAFGPESLDMAAETAEVRRRPTRAVVLLGGEAILRIFAGIEDGAIEVEWVG